MTSDLGFAAIDVAKRRQDSQSSRRDQGRGDLELERAEPETLSSSPGCRASIPRPTALVQDPQARIVQAFRNLKLIAESEGAGLKDCVRLTVYVSDLHRYAPMVDKAQAELWGGPPYPPGPWSRSNGCSTTISLRSTACFTPRRRSSRTPLSPKAPSPPARRLDAGQGCSASTITKILGLCPLRPLRY